MSDSNPTLHELSDEEIAQGIHVGRIPQKRGIEELITRNTLNLWRYTTSKSPDDLVEDIVAETIVVIWEKFDTYNPGSSKFLTWAIGIARFKILEALRKAKKHQPDIEIDAIDEEDETNIYEIIAAAENTELELENKELEKKALSLILSFPEVDRTLFLLKHNYDLTYMELAEILSEAGEPTTPDAIAQRFSRMRGKLKQMLQE
jgi:RNA polymerase sigma factor (sigma-70 family)